MKMDMVNEIKRLVALGDGDAALEMLEREGDGHMEEEEVLLEWGKLLYAKGRRTEALNRFNALLRLDPENATARNYVSMINSILGYYCKDLLNP